MDPEHQGTPWSPGDGHMWGTGSKYPLLGINSGFTLPVHIKQGLGPQCHRPSVEASGESRVHKLPAGPEGPARSGPRLWVCWAVSVAIQRLGWGAASPLPAFLASPGPVRGPVTPGTRSRRAPRTGDGARRAGARSDAQSRGLASPGGRARARAARARARRGRRGAQWAGARARRR